MAFLIFLLFLAGCTAEAGLSPNVSPTAIHGNSTFTPTLTPAQLPSLEEVQVLLLDLLNRGEEFSFIIQAFADKGIAIEIVPVDVDNDNAIELLVTALGVYSALVKQTNIWVFKQFAGIFQIEYNERLELTDQPRIVAIDDVNHDGRSEVVIESLFATNEGACEIQVVVIGWQDENVVDLFANLPTGICGFGGVSLGEVVNGNRRIVVSGSTSTASMGAGPGRGIVIEYALGDNGYEEASVTLLPSDIRFFVLQDAQIAYDEKNYDHALTLWDKAAHDRTLENYPSFLPEGEDQPEIYQPAYTLYRMYALHLLMGDEQSAQMIFDELAETYPEGEPGGEFVGIARKVAELLAASRDPDFVCTEIYNFISISYPYDFLLGHWYWGYSNQNIIDFCPLNPDPGLRIPN